MRPALGLIVLIAVALAAWLLLREGPRGRGDVVSRAVPVAPGEEAWGTGEEPRDVDGPSQAEPGAAPERAAAEAAPAEEDTGRTGLPDSAAEAAVAPPLSHVRGRVRSESGTWRDLPGTVSGGVVVELVDPADPGVSRQAQLAPVEEPDGSVALAFAFEDVPAGSYRLVVSSLVAEVWDPREQTVHTPADDVEIWCRDRIDRVRLTFDVRDAETGEPVEGVEVMSLRQTVSQQEGVLLHAGELPREAFPIDGRVDWSVFAPGYAPAFGDETTFVPSAEGEWRASVQLRRGWGALVVVMARDPSMRPIDGATVHVDGTYAGRTGLRGWLHVERPEAPGRITAAYKELVRDVDAPRAPDSSEARRRGQLLPIVLE